MKEIKYQRSVSTTRPAVWPRELPRDWKDPMDCSPTWWKEALGIAIAVILFFLLPWGLHFLEAAIKEVAK